MRARFHPAVALALPALALAGVGPALAASPAAIEAAAFAKELRGYVKPAFTKQEPDFVLGKVTCAPPAKGSAVHHCLAHFTYAAEEADIVYEITATLAHGHVQWATTSHSCTSTTTGRKLEC